MVSRDHQRTPPLTLDEIKSLMMTMTHYDGRERGKADADALSQAATRAGWTLAEARDAVQEHFAFATGEDWWIKPGHITERIRERRREYAHRAPGDTEKQLAKQAARMLASGGDDPHHGGRNSPELESLHTEAMTVPCGRCKAAVGQRCTNPITGNSAKIPHTARSKAARDRIEAEGRRSAFRL